MNCMQSVSFHQGPRLLRLPSSIQSVRNIIRKAVARTLENTALNKLGIRCLKPLYRPKPNPRKWITRNRRIPTSEQNKAFSEEPLDFLSSCSLFWLYFTSPWLASRLLTWMWRPLQGHGTFGDALLESLIHPHEWLSAHNKAFQNVCFESSCTLYTYICISAFECSYSATMG